jgi:hypothetical protein
LEDAHRLYVQQFEEAEQSVVTGREEAEKARDYFDGDQFTEEEIAALRKRKQPITPENLIKPKVEGLCGLERQGRTDPQAYPRTQEHDQDAQAATDALRYVADDQDVNVKKSRVFENMLVEGFGGVEVSVARVKGQIDPKVTRIAWNRLYYDPHSAEADFSDAEYMGYVTWMDLSKAKRRWKDKESILDSTMSTVVSSGSSGETFDDRPRWALWADTKRKRVRINTHYHMKDGVWHKCVFTLSGELEESAPSPFLDEDGQPENPLILQSAYVDSDNDRYGIVRDMIPLQDEVNKRRSKFLHMVNNAKVRVSPSVGQDAEKVRKEMARPDGVIVGEQGEVEELGNAGRDAGQFQLLIDARATLKGNVGPNAAMQGKTSQDQSGRAILALQQAGMTEMTPLLDNLRHFTLRMYRQIWNRIRQYWTEERWVRVTDDDKNVKFVGVNVAPKLDPQSAVLAGQKVVMAFQSGEIDQQTAEQYAQQIMQMAKVQNPVAELDVDIDIEEVNEAPTLQAEQFEMLTQMLPLFGPSPPPEIIELIIKASQLRDKPALLEIVERLKQAAAQPDPMQQQAAEVQMADATAKVEETQSKTALNMARAENEAARPMIEGMRLGNVQPGAPM